MTNEELIHSGEIYQPEDPAILKKQAQAMLPMYEYNQTLPTEGEKRQALLKKMFASVGDNCYIEPPFHANWGGHHIKLGNHVYANFNLTIADDTYVTIGDHTMIGPNVTMSSAAHPILPELREHGYQYNLPITIGKNCWIGAGVIILPGVTIGDNSVIGAGTVVTRDIPANVVAMGVPAKPSRHISEHDQQFYYRDRRIKPELLNKINNSQSQS